VCVEVGVIGCRTCSSPLSPPIIHEREVPRSSRSTVYYSTPCADTACTRYAGATVHSGGSKCPSGTVRPLLPRNRRKGAHVGVEKVRTVFNTHVRFAGRVGACASPVVMDLQAKYAAFARGNGAVGLYLGMESKNRMGEIIRQL
jgi:stringent starvation protein B